MLGCPQAEGAPPATQFQDFHAVGDAGPLTDLLQRRVLRPGQGVNAIGPVAAAVFQTWAEGQFHETGRHLVVLFVGLIGGYGYRTAPQLLYEVHFRPQLFGWSAFSLQPQPLPVQGADARPNQEIRHPTAFHHANQPFHDTSRFGNQGMKVLVVCW